MHLDKGKQRQGDGNADLPKAPRTEKAISLDTFLKKINGKLLLSEDIELCLSLSERISFTKYPDNTNFSLENLQSLKDIKLSFEDNHLVNIQFEVKTPGSNSKRLLDSVTVSSRNDLFNLYLYIIFGTCILNPIQLELLPDATSLRQHSNKTFINTVNLRHAHTCLQTILDIMKNNHTADIMPDIQNNFINLRQRIQPVTLPIDTLNQPTDDSEKIRYISIYDQFIERKLYKLKAKQPYWYVASDGQDVLVYFNHTLVAYPCKKQHDKFKFAIQSQPVGHGSFATVFRSAYRISTINGLDIKKKSHAIKTFDLCNNSVFLHGGLLTVNEEARLSQTLPHLGAKSALSCDNEAFFVMRLIPGLPLSQLIHSHRKNECPLSVIQRLQISKALVTSYRTQFMENHIIHRDLKPDNVMICLSSAAQANYLDLGLARKTNDHHRAINDANCGNLKYFSPEQNKSDKSDLYAIGLMLLELWNFSHSHSDINKLLAHWGIDINQNILRFENKIKIKHKRHQLVLGRLNSETLKHLLFNDLQANEMDNESKKRLIVLFLNMIHTNPDERPEAIELEDSFDDLIRKQQTKLDATQPIISPSPSSSNISATSPSRMGLFSKFKGFFSRPDPKKNPPGRSLL